MAIEGTLAEVAQCSDALCWHLSYQMSMNRGVQAFLSTTWCLWERSVCYQSNSMQLLYETRATFGEKVSQYLYVATNYLLSFTMLKSVLISVRVGTKENLTE